MIRVGLVGFGMAGRVFHAPLISSVEGMELAAVVERHANQCAERYPGVKTCRSLDELLADATIKLVVVATPNTMHFQQARQILQAGKNVVVDKPMGVTSAEIAQLMELPAARGVLLAPFHNRRWDGDFLTIKKLLHENALGRLVSLESVFDRWNPGSTRRPWKDDPAQGGSALLDLGTHLADQALTLFGKPESVSAEVLRERDGEGANDAFTVRLRYPGHSITLASSCLAALARPRYHLRGSKGNYWKFGVDPQEAALNKVTRIDDTAWGQDPSANWGTLSVDVDGGKVTRPVEPVIGDYRCYYAGIRDALLGKAPAPVTALDAWRVARLLEWAAESSDKRREILCDWSEEPK
jgi:predicted dehydrogenase